MLEFLIKYWYLIAGITASVVFVVLFWRKVQPSITRKGVRRYSLTMLGLALIGIPLLWTVAVKSDAYGVAKAYVAEAPDIASRFGAVNDSSLRSFELSFDNASYTFKVEGSRSDGMITLWLKKDPEWRVERVESGW